MLYIAHPFQIQPQEAAINSAQHSQGFINVNQN